MKRTTSSSSDSTRHTPNAGNRNEEILLFERGNDKLLTMRTGFGFCCFQTAYWIWYSTEYIPVVNNSPMEQLHIDPSWGIGGILFSLALQSIFVVYPNRLVSRLTFRLESPPEIRIYTHHLPFIRPATTKPTAVIPVTREKESDTDSLLDPSSAGADEILNKLGGDITRYEGMLVLRNNVPSWFRLPWLMEATSESKTPEPSLLLKAMILPQQLLSVSSGAVQQEKRVNEDRPASVGSRSVSPRRKDSRLHKIARQRHRRR